MMLMPDGLWYAYQLSVFKVVGFTGQKAALTILIFHCRKSAEMR
jgi:hypothetical protein